MKKCLYLLLLSLSAGTVLAQSPAPADTSWKKVYRESAPRINDLVHTKLDIRPDFSQSWVYGKAWITLQPHFYATDSLTLDAKGMEFKKIMLVKGTQQTPLKYTYTNDTELHIKLDKTYKASERYTIYIDYIAKPDEYQARVNPDDFLGVKGFYFINPKGLEKNKPTQIWTQGETESSSGWFPTIDKTAQKTTQELTITVDNKYVTLSNGKLVSQKKNTDGTRSDYWKMDLPHSPYLFFVGVGDYAVIKDVWKGKEVNYYVEKEYAAVAKKIFGNTPEMMSYFSKITGVDFPWIKYSQITGRDYVAGAMENTTATIHQESAQQDARELVDGNSWEGVIAHELFHQWFGDYVTAESWSNLTLNESFADYSQTLWNEYKYGQDDGDAENYQGMGSYLQSNSQSKDLVRFHYNDKEDMFDAVSYQKGGRILHMLRKNIGDEAFFKAMNIYLTSNKFKAAEAHQWRLAVEEVTGRDMNWFFNQWYFSKGHPNVTIDYVYDDAAGKALVILKQTQSGDIFQLPMAIDVYEGSQEKRYNVWAKNAVDTFSIPYTKRPDLINVDGEKILLWAKKDNKTLENFVHQYKYAGNFVDRREAISYAAANSENPKAIDLLKTALNDKYQGLRGFTLSRLDPENTALKNAVEPIVATLAKSDKYAKVKAAAIAFLGEYKKADYSSIFRAGTKDSSYAVAGNSLTALSALDAAGALAIAKELNKQPAKGTLENAIMGEFAKSGDEEMYDKTLAKFQEAVLQNRFGMVENLAAFLNGMKNTEKFKKGIDALVELRDNVPEAFKVQSDRYLNAVILKKIYDTKNEAVKANAANTAMVEQAKYVLDKLPAELKKGF